MAPHGLSNEEHAELDGLDAEQVARYFECRDRGDSHNWALMVASDSWPRIATRDDRWGRCNDGKRMGVRGVRGKYQPALAEFPGDPQAFCESMGDARRRADQLGVTITDRPENAESGRQDLLRRARRGDPQANRVLEKELESNA